MRIRSYIFKSIFSFLIAAASGCSIKNDIPFPTVEGAFSAFEVEGMCAEDGEGKGQAVIDKAGRCVNIFVDDRVNVSDLLINNVQTTNKGELIPAVKSGDRIDFSEPKEFTIRTYQDYRWKVNVRQVIRRKIEIEGQIGDAIIDEKSEKAIIYISTEQNLKKVKVTRFDLGGVHGSVYPNPMEKDTYDFSSGKLTFLVKYGWTDKYVEWTVFIYTKQPPAQVTTEAFARTVNATISGTRPGNDAVTISYREAGETSWTVLSPIDVHASGSSYSAEIKGLKPGCTYNFKAESGSSTTPEGRFTTTQALQLENSSFDEWSLEGERLWNPWGAGRTSFWDTGNKGATTVGESNSKPSDDTSTGSGRSALLQSKYIVIKFAAGNIFTGSYVKTDGSNGVLDFGRPFTAFPSKLSFDFKFKGAVINRCGSSEYERLKGQPDECMVYIALTDWDEPFRVRTKPSEQSLFSKDDPHVIAYGEMSRSKDQDTWTTETITLDYKSRTRTPKYILVVCSSSRYGDFFTGGEGSTLQVDNFKLIYD